MQENQVNEGEGALDGSVGDIKEQSHLSQSRVDEEKIWPQFEENEFLKKWDEDYPAIPVPDEIQDDIDNDYNL